jgi:RHS repeat-associated protein
VTNDHVGVARPFDYARPRFVCVTSRVVLCAFLSLVGIASSAVARTEAKQAQPALQASMPSVFVLTHERLEAPTQGVSLRAPLEIRAASKVGNPDLCRAQPTLVGPHGAEQSQVECVNGAIRLVPAHDLSPGAGYTLFLKRAGSDALYASAFTTPTIARANAITAHARGLEEWEPDQARDHWYYAWGVPVLTKGMVPLLSAPTGQTALAGRIARFNGQPLSSVAISIGSVSTRTDEHGRFLLQGVAAGSQSLKVDGSNVVVDEGHYTKHYIHVDVEAGKTTTIGRPIFLARIDPASEVSIASPTDREVVLTHPAMPGLQVRIPKGIVLREQDGSIVTKVSLTPIPLDRAPYATPMGFPIYFALQPGGAFVDVQSGKSVEITYPNYGKVPPGSGVSFWNYDPNTGWKVYGQGRISEDGRTVVADASQDKGLAVREIMTFGWAVNQAAPPKGPLPGSDKVGDPVDPATGVYVTGRTDLFIKDVIPIALTRSYQQFDTRAGSFGRSWTNAYDITLYQPNTSQVDVVFADGTRLPMMLQSDGETFKCTTAPGGPFFGATLTKFVNSNAAHPNQFQLTLNNQSKLRFDGHDFNHLMEVVDRNNNIVSLTRAQGATGPITRITSPNGRFIQLEYTGGRVTRATDNIGRVVTYAYDTATSPRLVTVVDADQMDLPVAQQATLGYTYDSNERLWTIKDKRNTTALTNLYYADGRMRQQTMADGTTWQYSYSSTTYPNGVPNSALVTNPRGFTTQYFFNASGYLVQQVVAQNATAPFAPQTYRIARDPANRVESVLDPLGRLTWVGYDGAGNINAITRMANSPSETATRLYSYEPAFNQIASMTDEVRATTGFSYDARGNLSGLLTPPQKYWQVGATDQGLLQRIVSPMGYSTTLDYSVGDLNAVTDPMGRRVQLGSDDAGRIDSIIDPVGMVTRASYDKADRLQTFVNPQYQSGTMTYDANGNLKTALLPGHEGLYQFDYDLRNRTNSQTDPLNRSSTIGYDGNNNPSSSQDAKGQTATYSFDPFDRPQQVTFVDGSTLRYTFDAGNRLTGVADSTAGAMTIGYDNHDNPTQIVTPHGTVRYQFDASGRVAWILYPSGTRATYGYYDSAREVRSLTVGSGSPYVVTYNDDGQVRTITLPNGTVRQHDHNGAGQILNISYTSSASVALGSWGYAYDAAGRIGNRSGSLLLATSPTVQMSTVYYDSNQINRLNGVTVSSDLNGSFLSRRGRSFEYDVRGRLRAANVGATSATYTINALGQRDTKTVNGVVTHYLYDPMGRLIVETDAAGATQREYVWLGDAPVMVRVYSGGVATEYQVWSDHLNTPRVITDAANNFVWRWDSDAYGNGAANGNPRNIAGANFVFNLRFPGQYYDGETGLHYNNARDYDPETGRYLQTDPQWLGGGINLYGYAAGNPVSLVDPSGRIPLVAIPVAIGAITGGLSAYAGVMTANPNAGWREQLAAVAVGAAVGGVGGLAGSGVLAGVIAGGLGGGVGDFAGQAAGSYAKCEGFKWNKEQSFTQGGLGAAGGLFGGMFGGAVAGAVSVRASTAVGATASGLTPFAFNPFINAENGGWISNPYKDGSDKCSSPKT